MASEAIERGPVGKTPGDEPPSDILKQGELHKDVEVGPEMVDLDRIERVYKYVFALHYYFSCGQSKAGD